MLEFAQGFFNLDHPVPGTAWPSSRYLLRGWAVGKPGQHFSDVRVRYAGVLWPAVFGVLRPDLVAHFKTEQTDLPAQFEILITLFPGKAVLEFEVLDASGQWRVVPAIELEICGPAAPPHAPDPTAPVNAAELTRILGQLLRAHASEPTTPLDTLVDRVVGAMPYPRYLRHPAPPFRAFFHEPAMLTRAGFGRVLIDGYLFHEQLPVRRVLATFDLLAWQTLNYGGVSPIAPQLYPQFPHAVHSHANGYIDLPAQLPQPVSLRIYAELGDGSRHLCATQLTTTMDAENEKRPRPPASPLFFWRATRALRRHLSARGAALESGRTWHRALWNAWKDFAAAAPHQRKLIPGEALETATAESTPLGRVLLCTHNLNFEGAPLFFLEYARHLAEAGGAFLTVISAEEGPLRSAFAALGAEVHVVDTVPLAAAATDRQWNEALHSLSTAIDLSAFQLVVANTLPTSWAIHLAHRARRPSLFYIHESTTPAAFYLGQTAGALVRHAEAAFSLATRVSFLTVATRRYYEPLATRRNYSINPGWIDLGAIDRHCAANSRAACRERLGIKPDQKLVINLGTVCERKGQHIFARAVEFFWRRHPEIAAECEFWMVGGRATLFDESMIDLLAHLGRTNLRVLPATKEAYDYYRAADLFVCSSYEESFPRVVLEAMAFAVPILSTDVHGVPEMVRSKQEGLLVPPGDSSALADGLARLLMSPETAREFAARAQTRVRACFGTDTLLPRHLAFARSVVEAQEHAR